MTCNKTVEQPSLQSIKDQVLLALRPIVSYRSFKHGKRSVKAIAEAEYSRATESLKEDGFRRIVEFTIQRARGEIVKSTPEPWPNTTSINDTEFCNALAKPIHSDISTSMQAYLQSNASIAS